MSLMLPTSYLQVLYASFVVHQTWELWELGVNLSFAFHGIPVPVGRIHQHLDTSECYFQCGTFQSISACSRSLAFCRDAHHRSYTHNSACTPSDTCGLFFFSHNSQHRPHRPFVFIVVDIMCSGAFAYRPLRSRLSCPLPIK